MARWVNLLTLVVGLGMASSWWPRPVPPPPPLPWSEAVPSLSADGRRLLIEAPRGVVKEGRVSAPGGELQGAAAWRDVYLVEPDTGHRVCLTPEANGASYQARLDSAGRRAVFCSEASNLVPDDRNACADVFWCDLTAPYTLHRLSAPGGYPGTSPCSSPALSDGGLVLFSCYTGKPAEPQFAVAETSSGRVDLVPLPEGEGPVFGPASFAAGSSRCALSLYAPRIEAAGLAPAAAVLGLEIASGLLLRWKVARDEPCFSPSLAGETCALVSPSGGSYQIFVRTPAGLRALTHGSGDSLEPALSADGKWLAFSSYAALAPGDTNQACDVYLCEIATGRLSRLGEGYAPAISGDGTRVAFVRRPGTLWLWDRGHSRQLGL